MSEYEKNSRGFDADATIQKQIDELNALYVDLCEELVEFEIAREAAVGWAKPEEIYAINRDIASVGARMDINTARVQSLSASLYPAKFQEFFNTGS